MPVSRVHTLNAMVLRSFCCSKMTICNPATSSMSCSAVSRLASHHMIPLSAAFRDFVLVGVQQFTVRVLRSSSYMQHHFSCSG